MGQCFSSNIVSLYVQCSTLTSYAVMMRIALISGINYHKYASGSFTCSSATSNDICYLHCDLEQQVGVTSNCGNATHCIFLCEQNKCFEDGTLNAVNVAKDLSVTSSSDQCMKGSIIHTPNNGNATLSMTAQKSFRDVTINAGINTQNIIINCTFGEGDECKGMTVNAQTAQYLKVIIGANSEYEGDIKNGIAAEINCPQNSVYHGSDIAPCIIDASDGGALLLVNINTVLGIPHDVWIETDSTTLLTSVNIFCNAGASIINKNEFSTSFSSACWFTREPTTDPIIDPTIDPTIYPSIDPTIDPTTDPTTFPTTTEPTTSSPTTSSPTFIPTIIPTQEPTFTITQAITLTTNTTSNPSKYDKVSPLSPNRTTIPSQSQSSYSTPSFVPTLKAISMNTTLSAVMIIFNITETTLPIETSIAQPYGNNKLWGAIADAILLTLLFIVICLCCFLMYFIRRMRQLQKTQKNLQMNPQRLRSDSVEDEYTIPMKVELEQEASSFKPRSETEGIHLFHTKLNGEFKSLDRIISNYSKSEVTISVMPHIDDCSSQGTDDKAIEPILPLSPLNKQRIVDPNIIDPVSNELMPHIYDCSSIEPTLPRSPFIKQRVGNEPGQITPGYISDDLSEESSLDNDTAETHHHDEEKEGIIKPRISLAPPKRKKTTSSMVSSNYGAQTKGFITDPARQGGSIAMTIKSSLDKIHHYHGGNTNQFIGDDYDPGYDMYGNKRQSKPIVVEAAGRFTVHKQQKGEEDIWNDVIDDELEYYMNTPK